MNQPDVSTESAPVDSLSLDQRASLAISQLTAEPPEPEAAAVTPPSPEKPAVAEPAPDEVAETRRQRIAARAADIERLAEEERARVAASRARKQERQPPPKAEEPAAGHTVTDAATFWKAAEALGIPPSEMAAWLSGQTDPSVTARHAAKEALSPVEKKLAELEARQAHWEAQQAQAAESARINQAVQRNMEILANHVEASRAESPLTAAFREHAPEDFEQAVHGICDALPPGFTAQDVVDQLEENLSKLHRVLQFPGPKAVPSTPQRTKTPAAAQANVGNRLAAERATTVEDDDTDVPSDLEERARWLKARLAAG